MAEYAKLTKLEIIQLLRNSFQGLFLSKNEKKQLIIKVEDELYRLISTEYNK
jgi:adenosine deaminase